MGLGASEVLFNVKKLFEVRNPLVCYKKYYYFYKSF